MNRMALILLLAGCAQVQIDTLSECSFDAVYVAGFVLWRDINCTDLDESPRPNQADILKEIGPKLGIKEK